MPLTLVVSLPHVRSMAGARGEPVGLGPEPGMWL